jgi:hypothetical protein
MTLMAEITETHRDLLGQRHFLAVTICDDVVPALTPFSTNEEVGYKKTPPCNGKTARTTSHPRKRLPNR